MTLRNVETLFSGAGVTLFGKAETPAQQQLLDNIHASSDVGPRHITARASAANVPDADRRIAIILDGRWGKPKLISAMGAAGYHALYWAATGNPGDDVLRAARPYNLRLLGGHSAGIMDTRRGLNLTTLALTPRAGQVALISQSQSLTAAALDWSLGRNIGFSWVACTGAEADIDAADLLDHAALDPRTRAVVLQVGEITQPRKFMSAARAAARVKPVLVLQTRRASPGAVQGPDPVRSAAFERAGLVECANLGGLFEGLTALELLPSVRQDRIMVLGNGAGICALGTDALRRAALQPAHISSDTRRVLAHRAPRARDTANGIDLTTSDNADTVEVIRAALADDNADAVLLVHSPVAGHPHAPLVEAIAHARFDPRLMTVWLGLETALPARHSAAQARLPTFASADEAARAIRHRRRYHETREILTATPPPDPGVTANVDEIRRRLAILTADNVEWLSNEDTQDLLSAYDIIGTPSGHQGADPSIRMRVQVSRHPELGMVMSVSDDALGLQPAYGFAPLDRLLAGRMLEGASAGRLSGTEAALDALAQALVRLSKLVVDLSHVIQLDMHIEIGAHGRLRTAADSLIELTRTPPTERRRLALSPYPARMRHRVTLRDDATYILRAIQPADEPLVLNLLESLSPEEIRLRFFNYIRHFSHDMAARITQVDYDREVSLVISAADTPDKLAGMGTIIADPDGLAAEFALLVHRNHGRVGLGRHLLDCLLRQAGAKGITTVYGDILSQNRPMLRLAKSLGFRLKRCLEDPSNIRAEIDVATYRGGDATES